MSIVEPLKRFRRQFRKTQNDVATELGIKQASYAQYEQKTKPSTPSADTIIKLSQAYNISADYLLGLIDEPRPLKVEICDVTSKNESAEDVKFLKERLEKLEAKVAQIVS